MYWNKTHAKRSNFKKLINVQEIGRIDWSFVRNQWLFRAWYVVQAYILLKRFSERQNLLEIVIVGHIKGSSVASVEFGGRGFKFCTDHLAEVVSHASRSCWVQLLGHVCTKLTGLPQASWDFQPCYVHLHYLFNHFKSSLGKWSIKMIIVLTF